MNQDDTMDLNKRILIFLLLFCCCVSADAQWTSDTSMNTPVSTAQFQQSQPQSIADGNGGVIILWTTVVPSGWTNIFAQRYNANGHAQWPLDGVPVSKFSSLKLNPALVSDGQGGAIVAWEDFRSGNGFTQTDIYAQRINAAVTVLWDTSDVAVSTGPLHQMDIEMTADGSGGAVIVWNDIDLNFQGNAEKVKIAAQRITGAGSVLWNTNGVPVCAKDSSFAYLDAVIPDGSGGVMVSWTDTRRSSQAGTDMDIFVQRLSSAGVPMWTVNGRPLCTGTRDARNSSMTSDGKGGGIISWSDARRSGFDFTYSVYAQRFTPLGDTLWAANGILLSHTAMYADYYTKLVSDGKSGAIITWQEYRNPSRDISAQRIDSSGILKWSDSGVVVCSLETDQMYPKIVADGQGGAVICWINTDNGTFNNMSVSAQRMNSNGVPVWKTNGIFLSSSNVYMNADRFHYRKYPSIAGDGASGAVIAWTDLRNIAVSDRDIFAQNVRPNGLLGTVTAVRSRESNIPDVFHLEQNYPNPFNPVTTIEYSVPFAAHATVKVYDALGRFVETLEDRFHAAGRYSIRFSGIGRASGMYLCELRAGNEVRRMKMTMIK